MDRLAENSTCIRLGLSDAMMFAARDAIPMSSPYSAPLQYFLPIFSSKVDSPSQAFVWVHGLGGNANDYYCNGVSTATAAGSSSEILSVAPWFSTEQVTLDDWLGSARADDWRRRNNWTAGGKSIYWIGKSSWMQGDDTAPDSERYTTSFDAFDATVQWLRSSNPTLKNTSAVGFSAGSQFLQRWALFSQEAEVGSNITSVISDPSSYVYLERRRPASTCRLPEDTGANHTCDSFVVPDAAGCPSFDDYKYGLSNLGGALTGGNIGGNGRYLAKFAANATLLEQVIMATTSVVFPCPTCPALPSTSARPLRHLPFPSYPGGGGLPVPRLALSVRRARRVQLQHGRICQLPSLLLPRHCRQSVYRPLLTQYRGRLDGGKWLLRHLPRRNRESSGY